LSKKERYRKKCYKFNGQYIDRGIFFKKRNISTTRVIKRYRDNNVGLEEKEKGKKNEVSIS